MFRFRSPFMDLSVGGFVDGHMVAYKSIVFAFILSNSD